jgi:outer membrane immunogenic protein
LTFPAAAQAQSTEASWRGFYAGLTVGGNWAGKAQSGINSATTFLNPFQPFASDHAASYAAALPGALPGNSPLSVIAGGRLGYNFRISPQVVVGLEADLQRTDLTSLASFEAASQTLGSHTLTSKVRIARSLDYIGTVRGRLGWLVMPSMLVYGTGGLAYAQVQSSTFIEQTNTNLSFGDASASRRSSDVRFGWTLGAGVEAMLGAGWSINGEYFYYDLGSRNSGAGAIAPLLTPPAAGGGTPMHVNDVSISTRFEGHIGRIGLSYHFN